MMQRSRVLTLTALAAITFAAMTTKTSPAQISVSIGNPPDCPYGYYDYAPYACAPAGYYGPQWFNGGVFIGAGKWFHGPADFHGTVNNHLDPKHGYKGPTPAVHEKPVVHPEKFQGNEERDGRGHVVKR